MSKRETLFHTSAGGEPTAVDDALAIVLAKAPRLPQEAVSLSTALGRTLSEEISAPFNLPPFANSAMDGYAVRSADTQGASREQPRRLALIEDVPAGFLPSKPIQMGQATRVMTGAPVPAGADAVVRVENTEPEKGYVLIIAPVEAGTNVRPAGEDVPKGEVAIKPGSLIRSAELGMLAALGFNQVTVGGKPRVALITTGEELVPPGQKLAGAQIYNANAFSLYAQVYEAGGEVISRSHCFDEANALEKALQDAAEADLLLASGAVSAGLYDVVRDFILQRGEVHFYRVAMRPGWPTLFATFAGKPFFGLPGNPVSSMVAFEMLVRPALLRMQGRKALRRPEVISISQEAISSRTGVREYLRAWTEFREGGYHSRVVGPQGSGRLSTMVQANSLLVIPENVLAIQAGQKVSAILTESKETE